MKYVSTKDEKLDEVVRRFLRAEHPMVRMGSCSTLDWELQTENGDEALKVADQIIKNTYRTLM
jgi:hypothetical protein